MLFTILVYASPKILFRRSSAGKFWSHKFCSQNEFLSSPRRPCNSTQIASSPIIMVFTLFKICILPKIPFRFCNQLRAGKFRSHKFLFLPHHFSHQTQQHNGINSSSLYLFHYLRCVPVSPSHYGWILSIISTALAARTPISTSSPITALYYS
jgi:hypothetical protein